MTQTNHQENSEQDTKQEMKSSQGNGEMSPADKTIGAFLRDEREKKGLSYDHISEVTKLRPAIIEALENESWDSLPSPVFASGFIRSYGRALGLDEKKVMSLFQETRPTTVLTPKPLVEPVRSKKAFILALIFLLLALVSAYFLWIGFKTNDINFAKRVLNPPMNITPENPEIAQEMPKEHEPITLSGQFQSDPASEFDSEMEAESMPPNERPPAEVPPELSPQGDDMAPVHDSRLQVEKSIIEPSFDLQEQVEASTEEPSSVVTVDALAPPELTLKANVREMTWLKIFVDDKDPREYTFKTGERFQWKATKGFEILIGNAGGIDFELNGEPVDYVGISGEVVRLRLPKGYTRRRIQN